MMGNGAEQPLNPLLSYQYGPSARYIINDPKPPYPPSPSCLLNILTRRKTPRTLSQTSQTLLTLRIRYHRRNR